MTDECDMTACRNCGRALNGSYVDDGRPSGVLCYPCAGEPDPTVPNRDDFDVTAYQAPDGRGS